MLEPLGLALLTTAFASTPCVDLQSVSMPQGRVASAELVAEGPFIAPGATQGGGRTPDTAPVLIPAHCRVRMVLTPTPDSNINVELWMPTDGWNGRLLAVGNGGFAGSIRGYRDMQVALRDGYATVATDTGHTAADGPGGMFGLGHPERIVDFAYRAVHEMTVASKELLGSFYDRGLEYSYFKGCSTGGRQALMAAQRYPDDFDAIIAGALANRHIHQHTAGVARSIQLSRNPDQAISPAKAQLSGKTGSSATATTCLSTMTGMSMASAAAFSSVSTPRRASWRGGRDRLATGL